jgi:hypothetical protein
LTESPTRTMPGRPAGSRIDNTAHPPIHDRRCNRIRHKRVQSSKWLNPQQLGPI